MGVSEAFTIAGQFGPMGLMVGYLIWHEREERKLKREEAAADRELARERIVADLELARSFVLLTATIQGITR